MIDVKKVAPPPSRNYPNTNFHQHSNTPFYISIAIQTRLHVYVCQIKSQKRLSRQYTFSAKDALTQAARQYKVDNSDIVIYFAYPLNNT